MNHTQHLVKFRSRGPGRAIGLLVMALVVLSGARVVAAAPQEPTAERPHVHVVGTGGTIAGRGQPGSISGYQSGSIPIEDLLAGVTGLDRVADVTAEQYSNVGSTALVPADWLALAQRINVVLADGVDGRAVDGVVVTHGTDALEETAYFLNLTVRSNKPVVVVGSMRPATAISADGPLNLLSAVQVAATPAARSRGVMVVLNQEINAARDVTKTNARRVQTFRSRVWGALGTVEAEGPAFYRQIERRHTFESEFDVAGLKPEDLPRVDISYTYNGADGTDIRAFAKAGAEGIVLAASGAGATTRGQGEAAREAADAGIFIVRSTRTGSGRIGWGRGRMVAGDDLLPHKARILLMVALTHTRDPEQIQRIFSEY